MLTSSIVLVVCFYFCNLIGNDGIFSFIGRGIICIVVPNIIMLILLRNNRYFNDGVQQIKSVVHSIKKKRNI